jgi:hypothetical protein
MSWDTCDEATLGADPGDGSCWYFPTGCLPPGWTPCPGKEDISLCDKGF